ncbi:MAG: transposase, partial [Proteobacteria bacterium]|nr:transposase [Pseudomonadota bacterium]
MKTYRTIRYRLHPKSQVKARKLHELAGACRFVWNHFVGVLQDEYKVYGRCNSSFYSIGPRLINLRKQAPWLQDYSCAIVRLSLKPLETTYRQFWKGTGGLPKFHGKHTHMPSIPFADKMFKLQGNYLHIQKIGQVKLSGHNPYSNTKPVSGTIKCEATGWYAYIVYEVEVTKKPESLKPVGIDRNVGQVARSDGVVHYTPDVAVLEARKRRYQKMMARRQRGNRKQGIKPSHRYLKARNLHARTQQKIVQARTNWCHQVSKEIASKYTLVYLEDLNTRGMTKSAKGTADNPGKHVKQKAGLNREILNS